MSPLASLRHPISLPILTAACALTVVVTVAALLGYTPWESSTWSRWDSGLYEDIARHGYTLFRCEDEPGRWCGNAGWFPGYPWLVGAFHLLGLPVRGTAVIISWVFAAATILLLWATFLEHRTGAAIAGALFYAAFAPGQIYYYAVFPLSLLAFASVACMWLLYRERFVAAGVAGCGAALCYPIGVVLAPVSAIWILAQRGVSLSERLLRAAVTAGLVLVGYWIVVTDQYLETGHWNAFFLIQQKYDVLHGSHDPFVVTWDLIRGGVQDFGRGLAVALALQTLLVSAVLVIVLAHAFVRRRAIQPMDMLLLLWVLPAWALPLSQSLSIQRGQAALLPMAVLVARLPARLAWPLALAAAAIAVWIERYFLDSTLV